LKKFSFELYTSFATKDESIGLELIYMLSKACKRYKMPNLFIHHPKGSGKRLDQDGYFQKFQELEQSGTCRKVWVCGPPLMQEHFDRA